MTTLLAGFLGGTLMGLVFVTHAALVLVFRPPAALMKRASGSSTAGLAMALTAAGLVLWSMLGVGAALLFGALEKAYPTGVPSVPCALYLYAVVVAAAFTAIPAAVFLRDRLCHLAAETALFVGIFGWMVPALVKAL